jgi:hypothetical protein
MSEEYDNLIGKLILHNSYGNHQTYYIVDGHYIWQSQTMLTLARLKDWQGYQIKSKWVLEEQHGWRLVN